MHRVQEHHLQDQVLRHKAEAKVHLQFFQLLYQQVVVRVVQGTLQVLLHQVQQLIMQAVQEDQVVVEDIIVVLAVQETHLQ